MSAKFALKTLVGAVALAIGGTALANTTTNGTTTGDIFLNIVDTTNNSAFFFDTGISQASFNGSASLTPVNLASDPNYAAFKAAVAATDNLDYSLLSSTKTTTSPAVATVFFTTNNTVSPVAGIGVAQSQAVIASGFLPNINNTTSSTANSALATGGGSSASNFWGNPLNEGVVQTQLNIASDSAAIGTALAFYSESSNALRSTSTPATVTQFAGTWDLTSGGLLSYTVSSVPLPAPLFLLVSGLGLMGVMSRRGKSSSNDVLGNASAA